MLAEVQSKGFLFLGNTQRQHEIYDLIEKVGAEKGEAAALMRVNHVGEVCAQALYSAQALATRDGALRKHLLTACDEETDHLAWTEERLKQLGGRTSLLNPLWYAGAFGIGFVAAKLGGDAMSLGFVVETEQQVEAHLQSHLQRLPENEHVNHASSQVRRELIPDQFEPDHRQTANQSKLVKPVSANPSEKQCTDT